MCWRIITAHAERALQQAQDGRKGSPEAGEVLEIVEDETGGLFVGVCGEDDDDNDDEGGDVPDEDAFGDSVEEVGAVDIDGGGHEGDEVGEEDGVPALDYVRGEGEVGLAEDEVGADEVVGRSHCQNTCTYHQRVIS